MNAPNADFAVIRALARVRDRMIERARLLRTNVAVTQVTSRIDIRDHGEKDVYIEVYIDAELTDGRALTWLLEARTEQGAWTVEASVNETNTAGQDVIREYEVRTSTGPDALATHIVDAAEELLQTDLGSVYGRGNGL